MDNPAVTGPTYEQLEAQVAGLQGELARTRYERDLLRRPVSYLAEILAKHERDVLLGRDYVNPIPDDDEDCIDIELQLGALREARNALQAVEATPEKISRMREALEIIHDYNKYATGVGDPLTEKTHELKILTKELPRVAYKALHFSSLPEEDGIAVDEAVDKTQRYERALREIATRGETFSEDSPANEVSHALIVELPDDAARALYPNHDNGTAANPDFHHGKDVPF